ncbi:hypothetical protein TNCT_353181 [Trichonephila clavata]|uniref:Integrase zinc-binding domain-containing protein n=1 Tax=Trichonephila clavata TaxID=2740835 RepID=A0A8X6M4P2_TRICU|nr:hypothetical protein TNCT_353181 [Trichonephila clavata]
MLYLCIRYEKGDGANLSSSGIPVKKKDHLFLQTDTSSSDTPDFCFAGPLSADELDKAEEYLVREVQMQHFREEINMLNQQILKNSKLNSLRPYLDVIKEKFWIPQGRQLIRKIINRCLACEKYSVKPGDQLSGQLSRDRISE